MDFGRMLTFLRKEHGYTQKRLAEELHTSQQAISRWENNTAFPELSHLNELSKLYQVPLLDLINKVPDFSRPDTWELKRLALEKARAESDSAQSFEHNEPIASPALANHADTVEDCAGEESSRPSIPQDKWNKWFPFIATASVLIASTYLFYVGLPICVCYFIFRHKLPVRSLWLDFLAVACLCNDLYGLYAFLNHTIFDFGHSSVTPLSTILFIRQIF